MASGAVPVATQCTSSVERQTPAPRRARLPTIEKEIEMSTYPTHIDSGPTVRTLRSRRATDLGQLRSARLDHNDRLTQHVPAPAQAPSDPSTNGPKTAQSAAEVVGI